MFGWARSNNIWNIPYSTPVERHGGRTANDQINARARNPLNRLRREVRNTFYGDRIADSRPDQLPYRWRHDNGRPGGIDNGGRAGIDNWLEQAFQQRVPGGTFRDPALDRRNPLNMGRPNYYEPRRRR